MNQHPSIGEDVFVIVGGLLHMGGDQYPGAELSPDGGYVEFTVGDGWSVFVSWDGMFNGEATCTARLALTDGRHDNWYEHMSFSDWSEGGDELICAWATPVDVRIMMERLFLGWVPTAGEHSGVSPRPRTP